MSNKEKTTMAGIHLRKQQLRDDLDLLEEGFEERIKNVRTQIMDTVDMIAPIKEKPLKAVGIAVAAGLIFGLSRRKKRKIKPDAQEHYEIPGSSHSDIPTFGFRHLLMDEIKRIAARRTAYYISDLMDKRMKE